jgi:hypothetical protein
MRINLTTIYIILFSLICSMGCDGDPWVDATIQYRVSCDIETDLTIKYKSYNASFGDYTSNVFCHGDNWQSEFHLSIRQPERADFTPKIYVKNNTDTDTNITVEIFVDGILEKSGSIAGPYAELELKGSRFDAPEEGFWD